jgi:hypothetical protein
MEPPPPCRKLTQRERDERYEQVRRNREQQSGSAVQSRERAYQSDRESASTQSARLESLFELGKEYQRKQEELAKKIDSVDPVISRCSRNS